MVMHATPRIMVLGGGSGGLEAAYGTHMRLGERADITIISDHDVFMFKPNMIHIRFGLDPATLRVDIVEPVRRKGIACIHGTIMAIDPIARLVETRRRTQACAVTKSRGSASMPRRSGRSRAVWQSRTWPSVRARASGAMPCLVPPNNTCSDLLREAAQVLDTRPHRRGTREQASITWPTDGCRLIRAFGPRRHTAVTEESAHRGIVGHADLVVESVGRDRGIPAAGGTALRPADLVPAACRSDGIPAIAGRRSLVHPGRDSHASGRRANAPPRCAASGRPVRHAPGVAGQRLAAGETHSTGVAFEQRDAELRLEECGLPWHRRPGEPVAPHDRHADAKPVAIHRRRSDVPRSARPRITASCADRRPSIRRTPPDRRPSRRTAVPDRAANTCTTPRAPGGQSHAAGARHSR